MRIPLLIAVVIGAFGCSGGSTEPIKVDLRNMKFKGEQPELFVIDYDGTRACFYGGGIGEVVAKVPVDGEYRIVIRASCTPAPPAVGEFANYILYVDNVKVGDERGLTSEAPRDYSVRQFLKAGDRKLGIRYTNDNFKAGEFDRNFFVEGIQLLRENR